MTNTDAKITVWDAPIRVFHWLMVLSFSGAYLTSESEYWRLVHVTLGYTLGGLVAFRLVWGLLGTRYARFGSFVRGPSSVMRYLRSLLVGLPEHHAGHNPAGALAIVLLLLSSMAIVLTGWASYNDIGGDWLEELHEGAANFMLFVVGVHVAGVVLASWLHRENLVLSMLNGKKQGTPSEGIRWTWRPLALLLLMAVLGFWWLQWQGAPSGAASSAGVSSAQHDAHPHDD